MDVDHGSPADTSPAPRTPTYGPVAGSRQPCDIGLHHPALPPTVKEAIRTACACGLGSFSPERLRHTGLSTSKMTPPEDQNEQPVRRTESVIPMPPRGTAIPRAPTSRRSTTRSRTGSLPPRSRERNQHHLPDEVTPLTDAPNSEPDTPTTPQAMASTAENAGNSSATDAVEPQAGN